MQFLLKKNTIVLLLALGCAGVGTVLTYQFIQANITAQSSLTVTPAAPELVTISALTHNMIRGQQITEQSFTALKAFPHQLEDSDYIPWLAAANFTGYFLNVDLPAGAGIKFRDLDQSPSAAVAALLKPGERAITLSVDRLNTIAHMLQPKDRIDIFVSDTSTAGSTNSAELIGQNIEVLALDQRLRPDPHQEASQEQILGDTLLTLRASQNFARTIAQMRTTGQFIVALRNSADTTTTPIVAKPKPTSKPKIEHVEFIIGGAS